MKTGNFASVVWVPILAVLIAVLAASQAIGYWAEPYARSRVTAAVRDACPTCQFELGEIRFRGRAIIALAIVFTRGTERDHQQLRILIDAVKVRPDWFALLKGRVHLNDVSLIKPQVTLVETAGGRPEPKDEVARGDVDPAKDTKSSAYVVDRVTADAGTFSYVRNQGGTHAVLMLRNVDASVGAFGSTPELRDSTTHAGVDLQLGFSGRVRLDVDARPYAPHTYADLSLSIEDQNLKDLDAFFAPNAGVHMSGVLKTAKATSVLRGRALATKVRAVFDDFDIAVTETKGRGPWSAFFTNLGIAVGIKQSNADLPADQQTRALKSHRRDGESLVGFLLRGVKEAAISVAKKPAARALTE